MNKQSILKSTLCLLMALVCNVAWAQDVPVKQTSAPADGYYLMYSESSSGKGWVHYNKSLSERKFRVATDVDLTNGVNANQANYVWKLVNDSESGTFTLQNEGEGVYMPADASRGGNMGATTTANLKITTMEGEGNEGKWYVTQSNNKFEGQDLYIHTNSPGGYPNLSYYNGHSATGTSIRAQFYKIPETTYTLKFFSGDELVATSSLVYPAGIEMSENLISDAVPEGYRFLSYTLEATTYTVQTTPEAFLTVSNLDHGVNYPYTLSEEQETAVFGKELLTIAMDVTMGGTSNNEAFICASDVSVTSDNTTYDNNSTFVAVGTQGGCIRLFASAKSNGYYSGNSQLVAARNHKVVIVIDSKNQTRKVYVDGVANTANHFQDFYHFRENEKAHIYIGGGKNSAGDKYKFSGIVHSVQFFEGALTVDQLSDGIEYPETAGKAILAKAVTTNANMNIYGLQRYLGLVQSSDNYLCNYPSDPADGQGYPGLLDGNHSTYFHSGYSGHNPSPNGVAHYLQADLGKAVKSFRFYTRKRNDNDRPTKITIEGSNDKTSWSEVKVIEGIPTNAADFYSEEITSTTAYQYYRFTVNTTNTNKAFFTFSEFYIFPSEYTRVKETFDAVRAYRSGATVETATALNAVYAWNKGLTEGSPIVGVESYIYADTYKDGAFLNRYLYNNNSTLTLTTEQGGADSFVWTPAVTEDGKYNFKNKVGKYLAHKGMSDNAHNFTIAATTHHMGVTLHTQGSNYWVIKNADGGFDQSSVTYDQKTTNYCTDFVFIPTDLYERTFEPVVLKSAEEFENGGVYTFVTTRGQMGATESGANAISTARTSVADTDTDYFKWTVYKSNNGNYYLYNLGKKMFMGVQKANNTDIAFVETPAGKNLTFKQSSSADYPIMFSTDNAGVVNHSPNHGGGLVNWTGGWNTLNDAGSNHKVTLVSRLPEATLQEIANKVEAYDKRLYITATVEDSWENNPNTHFGSVRATSTSGTLTTKLKRDEDVVMLDYNGLEETTIDFTREYRGFEFQGFKLGEQELGKSFTITEELVSDITAENPLVAKFTATEDVTLFYDDDEFSYRIPAIATTSTGRLIAVSDYRHNLDDIGCDNHNTGTLRIDLVIRTSDDNGKTWSNIQTIAEGIDNSRDNNCAYGDAAIAVVGNEVIVMAVAGATQYNTGSASKLSRLVRVYSSDNGENWVKTDITEKVYGHEGSLYPNVYTSFFGSGRLAVDPNFNNSGTARIYGSMLTQGNGNIVIYSDDKGLTWNKLGGQVANANEPKIEILPNGQILFSARRNGGRNFNVFTYTDKANNVGTWSTAVNGCDNEGENGTNGETFLVDAKNARGENVKLLLQSQPVGGGKWDRANVSIWYKEISSAADHNHTPTEIANGWTKGMQVSQQLSAYSAMSLQKDGKIAFFFEEAPCFGDDHTKGYCMVYIPLSIEEITECSYYSANVDPTASTTINISLSDAQGNVYEFTKTSALNAIATTLTTDYPFITLVNNGDIEFDGTNFTYTNTVTLPFKVSNESTTVWHNIYWHGNGNDELVYLYGEDADGQYVPKKAPGQNTPYGNSVYNTKEKADNMSWAFYHAGNFTFTLKNKLTNKYIKVTSVANGSSQNAKFVEEEATAFEIVTEAANQNYKGDYSFKASVDGTVGYLCSTSASYGWATHYTSNGHQGGWATIVEAPDFETLFDEVNVVLNMFGDGLGQYSNISAENLAAVTGAKTAMQTPGSVKLNALNEYKTYESKTEGGTLNLPKDGQFFRVAYDYGNAGRLYMQSTASSVKGLEFTEATGAASIWVFYDNALYSYTEGQCLRETGDDRGLQAVGGKTTATFSASARVKGKYNLQCDSYVHANANNGKYYTDHCSSNNCVQHDLILEEVTSLPVVISNAQVNFNGATKCVSTLFTPVALEVPVGITAYIGVNEDNYLAMEPIEAGDGAEKAIIPAGTGVILMADAAGTYNFTISAETDTAIEPGANIITGTVAKTLITPVGTTCYVLAAKNGNVGLYRASLNYYSDGNKVAQDAKDGTSFYNNAGKAYLPVVNDDADDDPAPEALAFRFGRGQDTTEIELPTVKGQQPTAVYDLQGRRVLNPTKGIYIVNGKKVLF